MRLAGEKRVVLIRLRQKGRSIPEISKETGIAKTTIQRHVQGIEVPERFLKTLREKQGGSKQRAAAIRENSSKDAQKLLGNLSKRDSLILLTALYWAEGSKRDLDLINSDPLLIQTFVYGLKHALGIPSDRISITIRLHQGLSVRAAKRFWSKSTGLSFSKKRKIEIIPGKKVGKLKYGMCRVRVRSGIRHRLVLQSLIAQIGKDCSKRVLSA